MSDNTDSTEETEISSITDAYGEPIEYDGNPAHAEGFLAAMSEFSAPVLILTQKIGNR